MSGNRLGLGEDLATASILNEFHPKSAYPTDQLEALVYGHVDPMAMAFALQTLNMPTLRGVKLLATPLASRLLNCMRHATVPSRMADHLRLLEQHDLLTAELAEFSLDVTINEYGFKDSILGALIILNKQRFFTERRAETVKKILKTSSYPELTAGILNGMESLIQKNRAISWELLCGVIFREKSKTDIESSRAILKTLHFHSLLNDKNLETLKNQSPLNCSMINLWSRCGMLDQGYLNELMRLSPILVPDKEWEDIWIDLDVYHTVTSKHLLHILSVCRSNLNNAEQLRVELKGYLKKEFQIGVSFYNDYRFLRWGAQTNDEQQPKRNIIDKSSMTI